ncbi:Uncharacterised protein [[Clostridium] sordellii]|nr:Uncharacterised protein [[Clostridium] sordellii] [Paeniclostridium sordellii]
MTSDKTNYWSIQRIYHKKSNDCEKLIKEEIIA